MKATIFKQVEMLFVSLLLCYSVLSCGDHDETIDDSITPVSEKVLKDATTIWGISRDEVISYMDGYSQVYGLGNDILQFKHTNSRQQISYRFYDGKLCGTSIMFPRSDVNTDFSALLRNYSFVGGLAEGDVYGNSSENTIAVTWQTCEGNSDYSAIGFAPIRSDAYENVKPIIVKTGEMISEDIFIATVEGSLTGVDKEVEVGIIYGYDEDLSGNTYVVEGKSNENFQLTIRGLFNPKYTTTSNFYVYYQAYAIVDDVYYYGNIEKLMHKKNNPLSYSINGILEGDMILVEGGPNGDFYIMQTELPVSSTISFGGTVSISPDCFNRDGVLVTIDNKTFFKNVRDNTGINFRLPTREEWEYAARGGNRSCGYIYSGSNSIDEVAWYSGNSGNAPHDAMTKNKNELNIYDMSGNYEELCEEEGTPDGVDGPICGGSYIHAAEKCTVTS